MPIGEAIRARSLRRGATYRRLSSVMRSRLPQALELACGPAVQDLLQHNAPVSGATGAYRPGVSGQSVCCAAVTIY